VNNYLKKPEAFPNLWLTGGRVCVYGENMNGRSLKLYSHNFTPTVIRLLLSFGVNNKKIKSHHRVKTAIAKKG
jgi:hypothetical protein